MLALVNGISIVVDGRVVRMVECFGYWVGALGFDGYMLLTYFNVIYFCCVCSRHPVYT
jgi:hypothetical protein